MKIVPTALVVTCLVVGCIGIAVGQIPDKGTFDRKLYAAAPLSHFGTGPEQFSGLSASDKASLLACRKVLIALFKGLGENSDISRYLTPELSPKVREWGESGRSRNGSHGSRGF